MHALITYWQNYPLIPSSPESSSYENDLKTCLDLCERDPGPEFNAEYLMSNLSARGLLLLYYADNDISMEVISLAASTYKYVKKAFDYQDTYPDFYFITGLYNYYREAYPEKHPIYKTLAFLFPKGDKEAGLRQLNYASRNAIFLKAEAYSFLSGIYISFENDYEQATYYSKTLHELYPGNLQYLTVYIKNLLLIRQYDDAEKLIVNSRRTAQNEYLKAQLNILQGIVFEKKYHNYSLARTYYLNGNHSCEAFGVYANEYMAYGYFGLSRIAGINNEIQLQKNYRKKALDLTDYEEVNFDE